MNFLKKIGTLIIYDMCIYSKFVCVLSLNLTKNEFNQKIGQQGLNLPAQSVLFAH